MHSEHIIICKQQITWYALSCCLLLMLLSSTVRYQTVKKCNFLPIFYIQSRLKLWQNKARQYSQTVEKHSHKTFILPINQFSPAALNQFHEITVNLNVLGRVGCLALPLLTYIKEKSFAGFLYFISSLSEEGHN